jgi:hypothetical protein
MTHFFLIFQMQLPAGLISGRDFELMFCDFFYRDAGRAGSRHGSARLWAGNLKFAKFFRQGLEN